MERAPWGRKRYYAPLPILSVLLLTTVLAAPSVLRVNFLIFDDSAVTIVARVLQVIRPSGPTGTIVGTMTVTNGHPFGIRVSELRATLTRIEGPPITMTVNVAAGRTPINIPAGASVTVQFSGPFSGNLATLQAGQHFTVAPFVSWVEVYSTGVVGPFSYTQTKTCTIPDPQPTSPSGGWWLSSSPAICSEDA